MIETRQKNFARDNIFSDPNAYLLQP